MWLKKRIVPGLSTAVAVLEAVRTAPQRLASTAVVDNMPADITAVVEAAEKHLQGWCSRAKARMLVNLILTEKPKLCVEIGIYGGRSLVPCAAALRHLGRGHIYGIETWSPDVATEYVTSVENDEWWRALDFARIKREFYQFVVEHDLSWQIRVLEAPSADAAGMFREIDFLHIDGAHSPYNSAQDAVLYVRRLRPGGIVVFDDIDWGTTQPAYELLKAICDPVATIPNEISGKPGCAVLRKR